MNVVKRLISVVRFVIMLLEPMHVAVTMAIDSLKMVSPVMVKLNYDFSAFITNNDH